MTATILAVAPQSEWRFHRIVDACDSAWGRIIKGPSPAQPVLAWVIIHGVSGDIQREAM
jgi:hypothetical protein